MIPSNTQPIRAAPTAPQGLRVRQAVLQAVATFCAGKCVAGVDVSSADVIKIAAAFERWLEVEEA